MENTSPLIEALIAKATLMLHNHQDETAGVIEYDRFQEDMAICLTDVLDLENERDECIKAIKEIIAERNDAIEQRNAVRDLYNRHIRQEYDFQSWAQS